MADGSEAKQVEVTSETPVGAAAAKNNVEGESGVAALSSSKGKGKAKAEVPGEKRDFFFSKCEHCILKQLRVIRGGRRR